MGPSAPYIPMPACVGAADERDIIGIIDKLAAMKLADHGLVYLTAGEVEAVQIALRWNARRLEL